MYDDSAQGESDDYKKPKSFAIYEVPSIGETHSDTWVGLRLPEN
ncbi:MAG: hypothetical protein RM368_16045 [Nostoc sp. DedSLP03]|nr:hypothetical protein [Nostoc sp. DedSLP03]